MDRPHPAKLERLEHDSACECSNPLVSAERL